MERTDKITRILSMYSKLLEGGKIYKRSFCEDMKIDRRTFDRDIEDIRLFLSEAFYENELIYDRMAENYHLKNHFRHRTLSAMEVTTTLESLRTSQNLQSDEFQGIVTSVLEVGEQNKRKLLQKIGERYLKTYDEKGTQKATLKMQWDLQQCIVERDLISIFLKGHEVSLLAPVSLRIYEGQTYLFAYKDEKIQVFCVANIEYFQVKHQKFSKDLIEQFDKLPWNTIREKIEKESKKA